MQPQADDRFGIDPLTSTQVIALILGVVGGLGLVWSIPILGVPLAWPWLFLVPGWVIVRRVAPDLPPAAIVGIGTVASTYLSAHLVAVLASIGGMGRAAVLVAVALLVLLTVLMARLRNRGLAPLSMPPIRAIPASIGRSVGVDEPAWLIAAAVAVIVGSILWTNGWRETPDGFVSGGWNWSDLLVHVAIGNSLVHGNFPPQVPYFAGEPLTYHWFADFHGAITALAADVPVIPVFFLSSAVMAGVTALVSWGLAFRLTRDRRVATIAAILVVGGGGMGWLRLVGDAIAGDGSIPALIVERPYDNSWENGWPWFKIASVFGTGFLPHRATTFGLPGLIAVVLLAVEGVGRRPAAVLLAGLLAALLAPFHFYAFPATYLIVGLLVAFAGRWRERTVRRDAALFVGPAVLALPYVLPALARQGAIGSFRLVQGWSEARFAEGPGAAAFFYVTNLGIPVLLALVALVVLWGRRALPARGFIAAWLIALFLVPNLVRMSAVDFDMNKYFQIMWIAAAIGAAWLIARWPQPIAVAVIAASMVSPVLIAIHHATHPAVVMSVPQEAAGRWIETHTPNRAVFATDDFINSPVDLAGRLRITTFGPYVSNLGYDPEPRAADIHSIYCDGPGVARDVMARYGATYVLSAGGVLECEQPTDFEASSLFETVYSADGVSVWRVAGP